MSFNRLYCSWIKSFTRDRDDRTASFAFLLPASALYSGDKAPASPGGKSDEGNSLTNIVSQGRNFLSYAPLPAGQRRRDSITPISAKSVAMPPNHRAPLPNRIAHEMEAMQISGTLLVAVSGGADSIALLRALAEIADGQQLRLVVGHVDHALRPDSPDDADWVVEESRRLGIECRTTRIDVAEASIRSKTGIEETARRLRYHYLASIAADVRAANVATAHSANDLSETILFHLARGTGLAGLCGIPARRRLTTNIDVIRPMLAVSRADILSYLAKIGQTFREDPSNAGLGPTRNRIRHNVLPELREAVNPRVDEALARLSQQAREAQGLLIGIARRELDHGLRESSSKRIAISTERLSRRRPIIIRETLRLAWRRADWPQQAMTTKHWRVLSNLVRRGGRRSLPGHIDARAAGGELSLVRTLSPRE